MVRASTGDDEKEMSCPAGNYLLLERRADCYSLTMSSKYHLTSSGGFAKCTATVRPCPRGVHVTEQGKANIKAGKPETLDEKKIWNLKTPGRTVNLTNATPPAEQNKLNTLSRHHIEALEDYAGMDYFEINKALRSGDNLKPRLQKVVAHLDEVFSTVKPESSYVTYRGEQLILEKDKTPEQVISTRFFPQSIIESKGFFSTSLNPSVAAHFAGTDNVNKVSVVLEIHAKTGVSLQGLDDAPLEDEMLLPRGSKFAVKQVRPYSTYQDIDFSQETAYLKEKNSRSHIFTVVLEEI